jgi:hypothetical protein
VVALLAAVEVVDEDSPPTLEHDGAALRLVLGRPVRVLTTAPERVRIPPAENRDLLGVLPLVPV